MRQPCDASKSLFKISKTCDANINKVPEARHFINRGFQPPEKLTLSYKVPEGRHFSNRVFLNMGKVSSLRDFAAGGGFSVG